MNAKSSRSHAIFFLHLTNHKTDTKSTLYLVDLAGSERIKKSNVSGERIEEAIAINSSLTTLGKCIIALGDKRIAHVPFRESKLTKILQDALGGKCKTALIINLSPQLDDLEESISSLLFGQRAKKVQCKPMVTEKTEVKSPSDDLKKQLELKNQLLQEISAENRRLHAEMRNLNDDQYSRKDEAIRKLESKLKAVKKEHQARLEDMDSIMLQQEKEIFKLREKVSHDSIEVSKVGTTYHRTSENRSKSKGNQGHKSNKLPEFPEHSQGLRDISNRGGHQALMKSVNKPIAGGDDKEAGNKENQDMGLENYLAEHYLNKSGDHIKLQSKAIEDLEQANYDLQQRIKSLEGESDKLSKASKLLQTDNDRLKTENARLVELIGREETEGEDKEKEQGELEGLREELAVLREENSYLKEMNQGLESENQALEEEIEMIRTEEEENGCSKCSEKNTEKDQLLAEVKDELENLKNKLSVLNFENISLKDDASRMTKMIGDITEQQRLLSKQRDESQAELLLLKGNQEQEKRAQEEANRTEIESLKKVSERARSAESELERLRREVEEKEFKLESLSSDIAAREAQLRIAKLRTEELTSHCKKQEETISRLESNYDEEYESWMADLAQQKKLTSLKEQELNNLRDEHEILNCEKNDLENILEEYRRKEAINMTNDQDLERMKSVLLESNNWNTRKQTKTHSVSLSMILKESSTKINDYIDQRMSNFGNESSTKPDPEAQTQMMEVFRSTINKRMMSYMDKTYFDVFERRVLGVGSGRQLQDVLVEEYSTSRRCLTELSECFQNLMVDCFEVRMDAKMQAKALKETTANLEKFKNVLRDPSFEQFRAEFIRIWLAEIRENRAAFKLQSFFKLLRQKKKSTNLQKRHKTQYERFQAGSGKNLLQLLMKKIEDSICTLHEEVGILEEGIPAQNVSRKVAKATN